MLHDLHIVRVKLSPHSIVDNIIEAYKRISSRDSKVFRSDIIDYMIFMILRVIEYFNVNMKLIEWEEELQSKIEVL